MPWFGWILLLFPMVVILYLWLMAPSLSLPKADALLGKLYAHRGLHDGNQQVYENSMKAFILAADNGYGIEMDVQLTKDNMLVIHHDANTMRVCGTDCMITKTEYNVLPALPDDSKIPLFVDFLAMIAGRVPLVVEIKSHGDLIKTATATLAHLRTYQGPYCVESFHPQIVRYFRLHAPDIIRGQLASANPSTAKSKGLFSYFTHKHLLYNFLGRPHFIAYDCKHYASPSLLIAKHIFHAFLIAWTVKDQSLLDKAYKRYNSWIFEGIIPKKSSL